MNLKSRVTLYLRKTAFVFSFSMFFSVLKNKSDEVLVAFQFLLHR